MNIDIPHRHPYYINPEVMKFIACKDDNTVLRCCSNSNRSKMRIMAKWKGDVIVAKYNNSYMDVLDVLYEEAAKKNIYVCKTDKKFLTKSDLEIGQTMGELGF